MGPFLVLDMNEGDRNVVWLHLSLSVETNASICDVRAFVSFLLAATIPNNK